MGYVDRSFSLPVVSNSNSGIVSTSRCARFLPLVNLLKNVLLGTTLLSLLLTVRIAYFKGRLERCYHYYDYYRCHCHYQNGGSRSVCKPSRCGRGVGDISKIPSR